MWGGGGGEILNGKFSGLGKWIETVVDKAEVNTGKK